MVQQTDLAGADAATGSGIAKPMRIAAAVVAVLRLVTLLVSSYVLVRSDASDLVNEAFIGNPSWFRISMIACTWFGAAVSAAHLAAIREDSRRRIVLTAMWAIGSVVVFAIIRGWGLLGVLQPLEVATLFSSLFILRMVIAERPD